MGQLCLDPLEDTLLRSPMVSVQASDVTRMYPAHHKFRHSISQDFHHDPTMSVTNLTTLAYPEQGTRWKTVEAQQKHENPLSCYSGTFDSDRVPGGSRGPRADASSVA